MRSKRQNCWRSPIPPSRLRYSPSADRSKIERGLFGADGEDLLAVDFDFDAKRGADVAALDNAAAHPDVAGKIGCFEGIVQSSAARIGDEGMIRMREAVVIAEPLQVRDIFELAGAKRGFAGEGPIAAGKIGGAGGQADDRRGNV